MKILAWILTMHPYWVTMKRMASKKLLKYVPGLPEVIPGSKTHRLIKSWATRIILASQDALHLARMISSWLGLSS